MRQVSFDQLKTFAKQRLNRPGLAGAFARDDAWLADSDGTPARAPSLPAATPIWCRSTPACAGVLTREDFHVSDYSPWEGWSILDWRVTTILRGKALAEGGRLVRDARDGQLVPRKISGEVLDRPVC